MPDVSKATFLFYDASGSYTHVAEAVAPDVGTCLYFSQWQTAFPSITDYLPGCNLDGVERVPDFFEALPRADVVVFTDVGNIGLQQYLRDQGVPVWGAGIGCRLEQDRQVLKTVLKECGLPVAKYETIRGLDALREMLKAVEDRHVKISYWRGSWETAKHDSYVATDGLLDDLATRLGPYKYEAQFIVEEPIEGHAVEVGIDGFLVNGELLTPALWGYEVKDAAYLGSVSALPERLAATQQCLTPVLQGIGYRGPFCTEVRCTETDDYLIDFTARNGSPPSEAQTVLITNLADIMYRGAQGEAVTPEYAAPYVAQLVLRSDWGMEHALGLDIGRPDRVRIHGHCRIDGNDYAVSPSEIPEFGGAVGIGNTVEDAVADAFDAADSVHGYQVTYDSGAFNKAIECIRDGEELDLPWGRMATDKAA